MLVWLNFCREKGKTLFSKTVIPVSVWTRPNLQHLYIVTQEIITGRHQPQCANSINRYGYALFFCNSNLRLNKNILKMPRNAHMSIWNMRSIDFVCTCECVWVWITGLCAGPIDDIMEYLVLSPFTKESPGKCIREKFILLWLCEWGISCVYSHSYM